MESTFLRGTGRKPWRHQIEVRLRKGCSGGVGTSQKVEILQVKMMKHADLAGFHPETCDFQWIFTKRKYIDVTKRFF
jgi:hypothetical protein